MCRSFHILVFKEVIDRENTRKKSKTHVAKPRKTRREKRDNRWMNKRRTQRGNACM